MRKFLYSPRVLGITAAVAAIVGLVHMHT